MRTVFRKESDTHGIAVLESMPQMRTIFALRKSGEGEEAEPWDFIAQFRRSSLYRLPFPYVIHVVTYKKHYHEGKIIYEYGGISDGGLFVFISNASRDSIEDSVQLCPTDNDKNGLVCTNHDYDHNKYDSSEELIMDVITIWWNSLHNIIPDNDWLDTPLEGITEKAWPGNSEPIKDKIHGKHLL